MPILYLVALPANGDDFKDGACRFWVWASNAKQAIRRAANRLVFLWECEQDSDDVRIDARATSVRKLIESATELSAQPIAADLVEGIEQVMCGPKNRWSADALKAFGEVKSRVCPYTEVPVERAY